MLGDADIIAFDQVASLVREMAETVAVLKIRDAVYNRGRSNSEDIGGDWCKLRIYKEPSKGVADRAVVMTPDQVRSMLDHAATSDPELHDILFAMWLTGARPGEIIPTFGRCFEDTKRRSYRPRGFTHTYN